MRIKDISDRVYQGRILRLLDEARSSIVISMYLMRPGDDPKHPVSRLLEDLIEARGRGVEVTIYLNTKFKGADPRKIAEGSWFERLRSAGVSIHLVSPVRRLHDKLVIVDGRFVVEGSMNWSVSAIADNLESATLIESEELARSKLRRVGFFPIWGEEGEKIKALPEVLFPAGPPTSVEIPIAFLEERRYFPRMITAQKARALKLFLLLLFISEARGERQYQFSPEALADFLNLLKGKSREAVRRQVIRVLRSLAAMEFLRSKFRHGQKAFVELLLPKGATFTVASHDLDAGELAVLSDNEIFFRLIRARLHLEGKRLEDFPKMEIARRFFLGREIYTRTFAGVEN